MLNLNKFFNCNFVVECIDMDGIHIRSASGVKHDDTHEYQVGDLVIMNDSARGISVSPAAIGKLHRIIEVTNNSLKVATCSNEDEEFERNKKSPWHVRKWDVTPVNSDKDCNEETR